MITVLANGVTSLMALTGCHMLLLNVLIGLGEAWLLVWLGRAEWKRAWWPMVLANYASMIAGVIVLYPLAGWLEEFWAQTPLLYRAGRMLLLLVGAAFVLTVLIEAPFVLLSLTKSRATIGRRLALCVAAQAASYIMLCILYGSASSISLLTHTTRVRDVSTLAGGSQGWVYFYHEDTSEVWRTRLDGTRAQWWATTDKGAGASALLWAEPTEDGIQLMRLRSDQSPETVGPAQPGRIGVIPSDPDRTGGPWYPASRAVDFRAPDKRADTYFAEGTGNGTLAHVLGDEKSGFMDDAAGGVALATPFTRWTARYPSILPSNAVVFEFEKQVVIMDREKRIGVLALGTSPVVVLDAPPDDPRIRSQSTDNPPATPNAQTTQ